MPKISIIIPVYNTEKYVEECLLSISNQTFGDFEILAINDGSTDNSLEILKKYQEKEPRLKIFSQENKGLSAARNTGIEYAIGEYLMFVDSDDSLHLEILKNLYEDVLHYNVEVAMCNFKKVKEDFIEISDFSRSNVEVISQKKTIQRMLLGEWWSAWAKLYHHFVFKNVRFPVGKNYEDYAILVKIFEQCNNISYNEAQLYYYLTRENSITTSQLNERKFDEIHIVFEVLEYVEKVHPEFTKEAERNVGASLIKMIMQIDNDSSNNFQDKLPWLLKLLKSHYKILMKNDYIPFKQKVFVFLLNNLHPFFRKSFSNIYLIYKKKYD